MNWERLERAMDSETAWQFRMGLFFLAPVALMRLDVAWAGATVFACWPVAIVSFFASIGAHGRSES